MSDADAAHCPVCGAKMRESQCASALHRVIAETARWLDDGRMMPVPPELRASLAKFSILPYEGPVLRVVARKPIHAHAIERDAAEEILGSDKTTDAARVMIAPKIERWRRILAVAAGRDIALGMLSVDGMWSEPEKIVRELTG